MPDRSTFIDLLRSGAPLVCDLRQPNQNDSMSRRVKLASRDLTSPLCITWAGAPRAVRYYGGGHPRLFVSGQFSSLVKFTSDEVKR